MFNVNNKDTRHVVLLSLLLTLRRRSDVFVVNFEHISHLVLVFLLLTMSRPGPFQEVLTILNLLHVTRRI